MERTQWNIEIQNFSNDDGKSVRSVYYVKKIIDLTVVGAFNDGDGLRLGADTRHERGRREQNLKLFHRLVFTVINDLQRNASNNPCNLEVNMSISFI